MLVESRKIVFQGTVNLGFINPLHAELNPICHLLALFGTHPIIHVSRIRVNLPLLAVCYHNEVF